MAESDTEFAHLEQAEFEALLERTAYYYAEARRCEEAQAYSAGCVMLGAALEAELIRMVALCADDVGSCDALPRTRGKGSAPKRLLNWKLDELLRVAKVVGWLPTDELPGSAPDPLDWPIGDHAQVIKVLRNLVHPGRYLRDFPTFQVTADELAASFNVLEGIHLRLSEVLAEKFPDQRQP